MVLRNNYSCSLKTQRGIKPHHAIIRLFTTGGPGDSDGTKSRLINYITKNYSLPTETNGRLQISQRTVLGASSFQSYEQQMGPLKGRERSPPPWSSPDKTKI